MKTAHIRSFSLALGAAFLMALPSFAATHACGGSPRVLR